MAIYFYRIQEEYGAFSNFSRHGVELDGAWWPTTEHYFQAQKFEDESYREKIRLAETPRIAADLGRSRAVPLRANWESVKDDVMYRAVLTKFQMHAEILQTLLSTGDEEIIEKTTGDLYWGCGTNGSGKNRLGIILMRVRDQLRQ